MTPKEMQQLLDLQVKYKDWRFVVCYDGKTWLQIEFRAKDTVTGEECKDWKSRKWLLSEHMTKSEIVQTAFKAVLTALEHEARESFLYCGKPIFGPHFNVDTLWYALGKEDALEVRKPM